MLSYIMLNLLQLISVSVFIFGYITCVVGLYRFRTSRVRVHICGAAANLVAWGLTVFSVFSTNDLWINCGVIIWCIIQTWICPMTGQIWRSFEECDVNAGKNLPTGHDVFDVKNE